MDKIQFVSQSMYTPTDVEDVSKIHRRYKERPTTCSHVPTKTIGTNVVTNHESLV
jgi:hypothetical protein